MLVDRAVLPIVEESLGAARIVTLLGPRQAGKTTLVRHLADQHDAVSYTTLDAAATRSAAIDDPEGFVASLPKPAIIDEVQRAPDILLAIKMQVDRDRARGQFLLTGSADLRRLPTVEDALPGRSDYLTLLPFAQAEIERTRSTFLARLFGNEPLQISVEGIGPVAYADRLIRGGFPEAQDRKRSSLPRFFEGYVSSLVDRDIGETARIRRPGEIMRIIRILAARSGGIASFDGIGRDVELAGATVKSYVDALERLYLVRIRPPWSVNLGKRQIKAPKLYLPDSGMAAALLGADERRLARDPGLAGALMETFVTNEVERLATFSDRAFTLWHYRNEGREVDLVVEDPSGTVAGIEVKAGATVRKRDFAGLELIRDGVGDRFRSGVVLYTGMRTLPFGDRLWAVPLPALWS